MPTIQTKAQLMTASEIDRTLVRLAHEVVDKNDTSEQLAVIGIHRRGAVLGERLSDKVSQLRSRKVAYGSLDIKLYRDDLSAVADHPVVSSGEIPFAIDGLDVILVDDVLYTGRTVQSALGSLIARGSPRTIQLCTLIDRGHRLLPIEARFVGKDVETSISEIIEVKLMPIDGEERVLLVEKEN
ncbi:MAG: bifunctional pyr operon transcriptional regulator/uracil phosphoribosyltransferase [Solibacterales bacterium]|nr:bifunctional pyr operon transcriptional regulator/uracil phosphoribosyltransferase [Bryobacterales bacterium]|tara:strand:+ start:4399 stop:4950 length:552 start_codon:yes stop_codon:yes gene_type:complete